MSEFKVGDRVRKFSKGTYEYPLGYEGVVTNVKGPEDWLYIDNKSWPSRDIHWELVSKKLHPHHNVILAWLAGREVQVKYAPHMEWQAYYAEGVEKRRIIPPFSKECLFRIKPVNPNADEIASIQAEMDKLNERLGKLKES